jgi:hypothetical protein
MSVTDSNLGAGQKVRKRNDFRLAMRARHAAEALRYLGRNYPECLDNLRVLDEAETAAHEAAMRGDRDAYLEALRGYCRAGRDEALRIRRGAA